MGQKSGGWGHIRTMSPPSAQGQRDDQSFSKDELQRAGEGVDFEVGASHGVAERQFGLEGREKGEHALTNRPYFDAISPRKDHSVLFTQRLIHGRSIVALVRQPDSDHGIRRR